MNDFQSIESGKGLLKDVYDDDSRDTPIIDAMRRRSKKLSDRLIPIVKNLNKPEIEPGEKS